MNNNKLDNTKGKVYFSAETVDELSSTSHENSSQNMDNIYTNTTNDVNSQVGKEKIVIASTFTAEPLLPSLKFWISELNLSLDIEFAPYNQVFQELLNPSSCIAINNRGMNVILMRFEDWLRFREEDSQKQNDSNTYLETTLDNFITSIKSHSKRLTTTTFVLICPSSTDYNPDSEWYSLFCQLKNKLVHELNDLNNIDIINTCDYDFQYGIKEIFDPIRDQLGHVPYTYEYFNMIGTLINRRFYQLKNKAYKVIALDCDNTLWEGICGEVGPNGVRIEGAYLQFQRFLVQQMEKGMLLCLCSKNVEEDVWQVFEKKAMPLEQQHIANSKINWEAKSKNLKELANILNLGLDSFIFIDDNPVECAEVRGNCPEVLTVQWPEASCDKVQLLNHLWVLDHYSVTKEDQSRTRLYQENISRVELQETCSDYSDFLNSLKLEVTINTMTESNLPRVSQLTQRTNQFNFTTIRRKPQEIEQLISEENYECMTVEVEDRFGSYGLVGVMIIREELQILIVDTFLLSCRVLGRGVEYIMMSKLGEIAKERELSKIELLHCQTSKNKPAEQFIEQIGGQYKNEIEDTSTYYSFPTQVLAKLEMNTTLLNQNNKKPELTHIESRDTHSLSSVREKEMIIERIYKEIPDVMRLSKEINRVIYEPGQLINNSVGNGEITVERKLSNDTNSEIRESYQAVLLEIMLIFSKHLEISVEELDPEEELEQYQIDSYKVMDIMVHIGEAYKGIPTTLLFEHRNIKSIVKYILDHYKEKVDAKNLTIDDNLQSVISRSMNNKIRTCSPVDKIINENENENENESMEEIAIIGMNGLYPKANTISELWNILENGKSSITEIPDDRFNRKVLFDPSGNEADKSYSKWGAFIEDIDRFEATFFNISPREAELMDPQQRLFLQVVWGLLEDAGYTAEFMDRNTGVFTAIIAGDYGTLADQASLKGIGAYRDTDFYQIPNRISYFFNFNGPSIAIDTACSGSGTAIHLAYESLRRGECNTAVVGGVNLFIHPSRWIQYSQMHFHSPDGVCRPFGNGGNGTVFGEGIGAVLLKRLADAKADNDHIYGIIKATAINSGGKTNGFTVPNPKAQAEIISKALKQGKVDPRTVSYVEAHGTGTALGDPIEIRGLTMAFQENKQYCDLKLEPPYCAIGSIKANIGHSESSAALSGIIKVLLQMKHGMLVPSLNASELNPRIPFDQTPFYVQQHLQEWIRPVLFEDGKSVIYPRRAGISSFGAGGSNSHILLEEYDNNLSIPNSLYGPQVVILSSKNEAKLKTLAKNLKIYLEKNMVSEFEVKEGLDSITLPQIAYTLQVGRTSFDERAAFVVSTIPELAQRLNKYIEGNYSEENICSGNIKQDNKILKNLLHGSEANVLIESAIHEGHFLKLAQLWALGVEINWEVLHKDQIPGRVSLPGYQFEGERLWIPEYEAIEALQSRPHNMDKLHPMIDKNISTLDEQRFSVVFTGKEFFVSEHVIEGNKVFPGVGYIELARAAGELSGIDPIRKIKDIVWARPITVNDSCEVQISLYPEDDSIDYEVNSINDDGMVLLHGQGRLILGSKDLLTGSNHKIDLQSIKERCTKYISGEQFYKWYSETGFKYGNSFKAVTDVYVGNKETLAYLVFPEDGTTQLEDMELHPTLMDGALQTIAGLVDQKDTTTYLPFALGEIEILGKLEKKCYAYATLITDTKYMRKYNIQLVNEEGVILINIKDFSLRVMSAEAVGSVSETLYYTSNWIQSKLIDNDKVILGGNILIFDHDKSRLNGLEESIQISTKTITYVKPGTKYNEVGDGEYEINPSNDKDYIKLLHNLKEKKCIPSIILHFWSRDARIHKVGTINNDAEFIEDMDTDPKHLGKELKTSVYSVYHLTRSLLEQKIDTPIQIVYVYEIDENFGKPQYEAVNSFLKTICLETSKIDYKSIGYDTKESIEIQKLLLSELKSEDKEVFYQDGQRFTKSLNEIDKIESVAKPNEYLLKNKGVYLITGGAGGLGSIFAEYLAKAYQSRIILTGRSLLDQQQQEKIDSLKKYGAEVLYIRADISNKEDVEKLIIESKKAFCQIDGIIHSAGIINDAYIINKKEKEMEKVIAPKVYGTVWLDEVTKNEELDFFVMFSSISATLGNSGQTDYSYANSFMDYYAVKREKMKQHHKRYGKSIAINWPLWRDGGMRVDQETQKHIEKTMGLKALETQTGIDAFIFSLQQTTSQLIVVQGDKKKLRNTMNKTKDNGVKETKALEIIEVDDDELFNKLQRDLTHIVSDILKLNVKDIDLDEDMSGFGFDSISFTGFSNKLNDKFNIHVMPSLFYEHPSLLSLLRYLLMEYREILSCYYVDVVKTVNVNPIMNNEDGLPAIEQMKTRTRFKLQDNRLKISDALMIENEPIAIVGMSGVMPQSDTLEEFWNQIRDEKDLITEIPKDRWDWEKIYGDAKSETNKTKIKWGGFMKEVDKFDPLFFGISPREAELMDPQQRIFLEIVWNTLEDAGYKSKDIAGTNMGVFVGVATSEYSNLLKDYHVDIQSQTSTGSAHSVLANRISYLLNIHGPSEPIDTACSSSLTAVHRAVEAIRQGYCDMAIAGGVNVLVTPENYIAFNKAGMLSEDGRCKTFDKSANGYVRGEGSGALLLKPLSHAIKDGNHIYGLIKGSEINHGGHVSSLTTPNPNAQAEVIYKAWKKAGVDPSTIEYIEAHGTGTSLGDPIEINGLKKAFEQLYLDWGKKPSEIKHCGIGSVKTNIGHLEAAAGVASIIKVLLSIKNNQIPGSIHLNELNPYIQLDKSPLYIVKRTQDWKSKSDVPRRAGISSFGFGGTNAHVVIEEFITPEESILMKEEPQIIVLSAKNKDRLKEYVEILVKYIEKSNTTSANHMLEQKLIHHIEEDVLKITAKVIDVPDYEIDNNKTLDEYGYDPVNTTELYARIWQMYNIEEVKALADHYVSIEYIAQYLYENHRDLIMKFYPQVEVDSNIQIIANMNLSDIAYTLQVGRDTMPERLAVVVSDIELLLEKLNQYLEGKTDIEDLYERSNTYKKKKNFDFIDGEEGNEFIKNLIKNKRLTNIAKYWVDGGEIDWDLLHHKNNQRRISLPTYPFARESYWAPERNISVGYYNQQEAISKLHPMIDRNTSTLEEQKFTTVFSGKEFYFSDHVIAGNKILPRTAYIEMARAASELSGIDNIQKIINIVWASPIMLNDTCEVHICLYQEEDSIDYEVRTINDDGLSILNGQGTLMLEGKDFSNGYEQIIDIPSIRQRCTKFISSEQFYKRYSENGYEYGKSLRSIKELYIGNGEVLAQLTFPEEVTTQLQDITLHPSLMEGAFQSVAAIVAEGDTTTYLPFELGEIEILGKLEKNCYAYTTLVSVDSSMTKYNLELVNEEGIILIKIKGFSLRAISTEAIVEESETVYYTSNWKQRKLIYNENKVAVGNLLVFDQEVSLLNGLVDSTQISANTVTSVKLGAKFVEVNEGEYEINPANDKDYMKLLQRLEEKNRIPSTILHFWSKEVRGFKEDTQYKEAKIGVNVNTDTGHLKKELVTSVYSIYHLSQSLLKQKIDTPIQLVYGYAIDENFGKPHFEAVKGLLKTACIETSKLKYKSIGYDTENSLELHSLLISELKSEDNEVLYQGTQRHIKSIVEIDEIEITAKPKESLLKNKGVYLITGGAGGLGQIFAKHLAKEYQARLVLVGRSKLTKDKQSQINLLKKYGAAVIYVQADISKKEEVDQLITKAKDEYKEINGIIHSAGVIRDSYLINKIEEEMTAVLNPKVYGTMWLDEATKKEPLD
ncbi:MAG: hypothetical protein CVU84_08515 [Firmicutes bacterium HGW-Firmicutes-1]|nr:MAG: hypothetical protein CVU84_08515 [Firmicutes bacterium HGW-Firmicutes-1]